MPAPRHGPELILAILQAISGNRARATDGVFANHYSPTSGREWGSRCTWLRSGFTGRPDRPGGRLANGVDGRTGRTN